MQEQSKPSITAIINLDTTIYQITIVPLKAPRTIAYIANGFIIDDAIVNNIKDITSLEITFLTKTANNINVAATTMNAKDLDTVIQSVQGNRGRIASFLDNIVSDIVTIKQSNASLEFLAILKQPWNEVINKYLISIFYVVFVIVISAVRFLLKKMS